MAEIFPNEWLAHLIEVVPRANTASFPVPTALYMGLFTSQSTTTVPSADATLTGSATTPYTTGTSAVVECTTTGGYARTTLGANASALQATFPTPTVSGSGMRTTAPSGVSFPQSTGAYSGTVNGFFVATTASSTGQNTGKAVFYANFSDNSSVAVNAAGYTITVAPFYHLDG